MFTRRHMYSDYSIGYSLIARAVNVIPKVHSLKDKPVMKEVTVEKVIKDYIMYIKKINRGEITI